MKQTSSKGSSVVECVFPLFKRKQKPSFQKEDAFEQYWQGAEMEREAMG